MASKVLVQLKVSADSPWLDLLIFANDPTTNGFLADLRGGTLTEL